MEKKAVTETETETATDKDTERCTTVVHAACLLPRASICLEVQHTRLSPKTPDEETQQQSRDTETNKSTLAGGRERPEQRM
eukprot:3003799-Rhodomonas_salina.1